MIRKSLLRILWFLSAVASVALMALFAKLHAPLQTEAAPAGIISFELARTEAAAARILASWSEPTQLRAAFGLGLDYLFMLSYATAIGIACWHRAGQLGGWFSALGRYLAWGQPLAALLDAVENVGLWQQLQRGATGSWALLAWFCASVKFALVAAGLLYALGGSILIWKGRRA